MRTKLTFALLFVVNMMSAQMLKRGNEKLDTLCQTKFTAVYQYSINTSDVDKKPVTDSIRLALQVGDGVWKTWTYERYLFQQQKDEEIGEDPYWFMQSEAQMHIATTTVGHPEGKTISLESIPPFQYEVTEDTEMPTWNMMEGSDSVCGYLCQKAKGKFRGKTWNVLYAEDIPTTAGPWKLQGLPGLITYAADDEGIHTFKLIGIYQETSPITYSAGSKLTVKTASPVTFIQVAVPEIVSELSLSLKTTSLTVNAFSFSTFFTLSISIFPLLLTWLSFSASLAATS